jgi:hypothetical protein
VALKRRILLMLTTMAVALVAISGVAYALCLCVVPMRCAYALDFTCDGPLDRDPDPEQCAGTSKYDFIEGTGGNDNIDAGAGSDEVFGNGGEDEIHGRSGNDRLEGGFQSDIIFGESGADYLTGLGGSNQYFGGPGPDTIFADQFDFSADNSVETVSGGPGDDLIIADDIIPHQDVIDCGSGFDLVNAGPEDEVNLDNCEDVF